MIEVIGVCKCAQQPPLQHAVSFHCLQRNSFMTFLHDIDYINQAPLSRCSLADADRVWSAIMDDMVSHEGMSRNTWVPDDSWMVGEFMAAIVRLSVNKYLKVWILCNGRYVLPVPHDAHYGPCDVVLQPNPDMSLEAGIERFFAEHFTIKLFLALEDNLDTFKKYAPRVVIHSRLNRHAELSCAALLCRDRLYTDEINDIFKGYGALLRSLHITYAKPLTMDGKKRVVRCGGLFLQEKRMIDQVTLKSVSTLCFAVVLRVHSHL